MLSIALIVAALLAGVAGSWSPCGLSMIETLGRRRGATLTFALGSLAGGAITFGGLALLGTTLFGPLVALAAAALVVAALGDAAGRRIVPQVRRQVPESWRRFLPLPLATGLYGVLLGLGFTTFLLSYATWALAAACLAIGTPETGLAVGLAFGAGRALPVALLPDSALLGERPHWLRALRGAVAAALAVAAAVLLAAPPAARAADFAANARDPSASAGLIAFQPAEGPGVLVRGGQRIALPGTHPAVSGSRVAWLAAGQIEVADAATLAPLAAVPAPGADALALSDSHVAWRAGGKLFAVALAAPTAPAAEVISGRSVGRPTLDGHRVLFDYATATLSRILERDLATGALRRLRGATGALLLAPTRVNGQLLYVRSTSRRQKLVLGSRVIYSTTPTARRDAGHEKGHSDHRQGYSRGGRPKKAPRPAPGVTVTLWTTAFDGTTAFVTRLRHRRSGRTESRILRFGV